MHDVYKDILPYFYYLKSSGCSDSVVELTALKDEPQSFACRSTSQDHHGYENHMAYEYHDMIFYL